MAPAMQFEMRFIMIKTCPYASTSDWDDRCIECNDLQFVKPLIAIKYNLFLIAQGRMAKAGFGILRR